MSADDLRPPGREILDIARVARTPRDEDRDRVYQAVMAGLGGAAAGTTKVAAAAAKVAGKSSITWLKWALPAALLSSAGIGTYAWTKRHQASPPSAPEVEVASQQARPDTPPSEAASAVDPTPLPAPAPLLAPTAGRSAKAPSAKVGTDDLGHEVSLLHQAHAAWRSGDATHALELARDHARRFPSSQLRFERNALEVRALCALGRDGEARKIAEQLRLQAPSSPVTVALKDSCVAK